MQTLTLLTINGAALIVLDIVTMLAIFSGIGILTVKAKKRNWAFYFLQFVMFAGLMLLFDRIIGTELRLSVITSLGSAAIYTLCIFLSDRKHKNK